jgi:hypothetical protein
MSRAETQMRIVAAGIVAALGLIGVSGSAGAAPVTPPEAAAASPAATLVRDGCGRGYHLERWRDRYGRWHRRCVPSRRPYYPPPPPPGWYR